MAGCRSIAVISRKGGVGKTTTTLMLGHTFASLRGDRVVALDGNPDAGSLGYRVRRETAATVTNLLADEQEIIRYADIRSYTNQAPTRLEVVASDDDPRITTALGEEDYRRAIALLERHYNLILLDTGPVSWNRPRESSSWPSRSWSSCRRAWTRPGRPARRWTG